MPGELGLGGIHKALVWRSSINDAIVRLQPHTWRLVMNSHRARAPWRRGQGTDSWERPALLLATGSSSEVEGPSVPAPQSHPCRRARFCSLSTQESSLPRLPSAIMDPRKSLITCISLKYRFPEITNQT